MCASYCTVGRSVNINADNKKRGERGMEWTAWCFNVSRLCLVFWDVVRLTEAEVSYCCRHVKTGWAQSLKHTERVREDVWRFNNLFTSTLENKTIMTLLIFFIQTWNTLLPLSYECLIRRVIIVHEIWNFTFFEIKVRTCRLQLLPCRSAWTCWLSESVSNRTDDVREAEHTDSRLQVSC